MSLKTVNDASIDLATCVERVVRSRTSGAIRDLHVSLTDEGNVVLSGRTTTYYAKQLASHAAMNAAQDVAVSNEIEVY